MASLVVNAGSSSHKLVLFDAEGCRRWSGAIDWSERGGALSQGRGRWPRPWPHGWPKPPRPLR